MLSSLGTPVCHQESFYFGVFQKCNSSKFPLTYFHLVSGSGPHQHSCVCILSQGVDQRRWTLVGRGRPVFEASCTVSLRCIMKCMGLPQALSVTMLWQALPSQNDEANILLHFKFHSMSYLVTVIRKVTNAESAGNQEWVIPVINQPMCFTGL